MVEALYIGTRRYSSWSMRGWLAVRLAGLGVQDVVVPLQGGGTPALRALTPTGLVPALVHDGITIWDSLAICEYCAELAPSLWPPDRKLRAVARSVAAEMHTGFGALRAELPMNLGRVTPGRALSEAALTDIVRVETVWGQCLAAGGRFLFGATPTVPDVMYAPVVARLLSYATPISPVAAAYCSTVRALPAVEAWYRLAAVEPLSWRLAKYEDA